MSTNEDFNKLEQEYLEQYGGEWTEDVPQPNLLKNFWFFETAFGPNEKLDFFEEIRDFIRQAREYGYLLPEWEPEIKARGTDILT